MPPNASSVALGRCYTLASWHAQIKLGSVEPERRLLIVLDVGRRLAISRGLITA